MSDTLLLISIGPVQDFIASARKLRDLWFGSMMLSEFSKTVARTLVENDAELIFPALENEQDNISIENIDNSQVLKELAKNSPLIVANKILAAVESPEQADKLQKAAKKAWREHFDNFADSIRNVLREKNISIDRELFAAELKDYGEFYAAWTSIDNAESYQDARSRVESLLASRKNFRSFSAPEWDGSGLHKNSLDGMRENVFTGEPEEITGLLKKHEKLDAIGCIKRFGFLANEIEKKHFFDLAEIALVPWFSGSENEGGKENDQESAKKDLVKKFQNQFPKKALLSFGKRNRHELMDLSIGAENFFLDRAEIEKKYPDEAKGIWNCREEMIKKCGKPCQYSVIMVGDGDRMGKMIDSIPNKDMHKTFSRKLSEFSKNVSSKVEDAGGSLIYAGGDDVMAYLPLHTAVTCADSIRQMFHDEMKELCNTIKLDVQHASTFSAGLAVVHYKYPLDKALDLARKAESIAKDSGRNSLALIQSKRSGADITVCGKWDSVDGLPGITERFEAIKDLYRSEGKELPSNLGYSLRQVKFETGGNSEMHFVSGDGNEFRPANAVAALVLRIFNQKNDGDVEKNNRLRKLLIGRNDVDQLSKELVVGRLISDAARMVEGKGQNDE
ncbi:type III-B CRISPR-associated protein Cas10/Cmr2 [Maridesulfovibrio sp.]|uniref:type III-B CRISPR-associated protein Cas10/Cmr2 n=1 Tax=unclassified Maridesulfovibrio TaxID=2794999 RepID=UPI003AFFD0C2